MAKRQLEHWESTPEHRQKSLLQDLRYNRERLARLRDSFNETQEVFVELSDAVNSLSAAERIFKEKIG